MIPIVDQRACIGCGQCETLCPQVFKLKDGKCQVIDYDPCEKGFCDCKRVAQECVPKAIKIYDDF